MKEYCSFSLCIFNFIFLFSIYGSDSVYAQENQPNILFIVSEDNGPELACYGTPIATPHLDKLANQGLLFENAYVPQAGCSPSRAAFLTGLYPHQNGQIGLATWEYEMYNAKTPSIPNSLGEAGYSTGIIGKIHVNPESAFSFDFEAIAASNFERKEMNRYAKEAEAFITNTDKPFFLQVNFPDAHKPFLKQVEGLPVNPLEMEEVESIPYFGLNHPRLKELTANYYNSIMRLDSHIGDLIEVLKKSGKYDNTLIVYIGDHGADMLRGKRTSYEGGVRIPMILSWPKKNENSARLTELVSTIDLFPTFLDAAGQEIPEYLPGKSLLSLINGQKTKWRKYLYTEYHVHSNHNPYPQRSVRNDRYKLIFNPMSGSTNPGCEYTFKNIIKVSQTEILMDADPQVIKAYELMKNPPEYELYDLKEDPYEFKNLADDTAYAHILDQLCSALLSWQKETSDPLIDADKAERLFHLIQGVGTDQKPRVKVPYASFLDPKLKLNLK